MNIKDRVAVVTGSAGGIGEGIIRQFASSGSKVVVNDLDESRINRVVSDLREQGFDAIGIAADITKKEQVDRMFAAVKDTFGRVDILVNNAGIERDKSIRNMSEEDWDAVIDVNLKGTFLCSKAAAEYMREQQFGRIVNISSRAWLGWFAQANYAASKGGVVSLTRALAIELGKYGITVNCVAPGLIETDLFKKLSQEVKDRLMEAQPTKTIGRPQDVARAVQFFCADEASFITGQIMYACGGKSLFAAPSTS
jgi:NAD(P)-dependent dehydrogenase (short-subunit alcohol dehydrogenase family)